MSRVAIFVDAGYFLTQGSVTITGSKQARSELRLNGAAAQAALSQFAREKSDNARLLRTYWYDAQLRTGPTAEQIAVGSIDYVKLRLGVLNGFGEQKGVDSLIVTDLIELARNGAISEAVLVSGDEDLRIAVQIAQSFGVTVHLLGLAPARVSQSPSLRQEADTLSEWDVQTVGTFLTANAVPAPVIAPVLASVGDELPSEAVRILDESIGALQTDTVGTLKIFWEQRTGLPPEQDRPLMARCRDALGRDLSREEMRDLRRAFTERVQALPAYGV